MDSFESTQSQGTMAHTYHPSTQKAEAGRLHGKGQCGLETVRHSLLHGDIALKTLSPATGGVFISVAEHLLSSCMALHSRYNDKRKRKERQSTYSLELYECGEFTGPIGKGAYVQFFTSSSGLSPLFLIFVLFRIFLFFVLFF